MRKRKVLILAMIAMLTVLGMQDTVYAKEPYEKIANSKEWVVLKKVNKERMQEGLAPLSICPPLQKAAGDRAKEIIKSFSHNRPDGSSCFTVLDDYGIDYRYVGENIAAGYQTASEVMAGWMNSSGHRENVLGKYYTHVGVGYVSGGSYGKNWTQVFVGSCGVKSVQLNDKGTPNYPKGTSIDKMNRYLTIRCDMHGVGYVPVVSEMCKGYNPDKTGYQTVTVSYRGKKVKMPVTIGKKSSYQQPSVVKNVKVSAKTDKTVTLKWSKRNGKGYEVWMATSANGTYKKVRTLTSAKKTSYKVSSLESGKKYYFKVRAYKKAGGKKIYGLFSKPIVVKTK